MKKIIASVAAAGVLVVGAFAASTITSSEAAAQTDEAPAVTDEVRRPHPGGILDDVLGGLVEDGTLTQDQADAVKDAMVAKREELKEKFGDRIERRVRRHRMRAQIQEWLEDGVITADELSELPEDLPILADDGPLADALEDGQITQEEWDAFIEQRKADHQARRDAAQGSVTG
jgi:Spy/CpxP family protein refolding chaperone